MSSVLLLHTSCVGLPYTKHPDAHFSNRQAHNSNATKQIPREFIYICDFSLQHDPMEMSSSSAS
jgi:hypothetical protein